MGIKNQSHYPESFNDILHEHIYYFCVLRLFRIMSIPTTFRRFRALTSEMFGRRLPVFTLLLWQRYGDAKETAE